MEREVYCNKCDNRVVEETNEELKKEYPYYCEHCDENLYLIETWEYIPLFLSL